MDSLDRTNVVQSMIASENLTNVLRNVGILSTSDVIDTHSDFYKLFRHVWADHANVLACQYAGSQALKTDVTRTGKRTFTGMLRDLKTAIVRYIKNNFSDGYRQDSIDLVLGHYKVDIYSGPNGKKSKSLIFYLPLILMMTLSFLLLTTLIFSESDSEFVLLLICIISTAMFLALMMLRHSRVYIDLPKYCAFELVDTLKLN